MPHLVGPRAHYLFTHMGLQQMKLWRHIKRVIQMRPDRSHRVSTPDARGYRTNSVLAVAMEDPAFNKFMGQTKLTATYLVATSHSRLQDRNHSIDQLMALAYLSGKDRR